MDELVTPAIWKDDCQGKKDYDGMIVLLSTRYWPPRDYRKIGGSLTRPSAKSSMQIQHGKELNEYGYMDAGDSITLIEKEFEDENPKEVFKQVEEWAQNQMNTISKLLIEYYKAERSPKP